MFAVVAVVRRSSKHLAIRAALSRIYAQPNTKLGEHDMRWHPQSIYDFPRVILSGLSESAFDWQQEGYVRSGEPVKIFFSCKEPNPPYAEELIRALHLKAGISHRSHLPDSVPVSVVDQIENADAVVRFYDHPDGDEGVYYDVMIPGCPEMGGWFCDDDHKSV